MLVKHFHHGNLVAESKLSEYNCIKTKIYKKYCLLCLVIGSQSVGKKCRHYSSGGGCQGARVTQMEVVMQLEWRRMRERK